MRTLKLGSLSLLAMALAACQTTTPLQTATSTSPDPSAILSGEQVAMPSTMNSAPKPVSPYAPAQEDLSTRGDYVAGGLYKPGVNDSIKGVTVNADLIPEPDVIALPLSRYGNKPVYSVLGKNYNVLADTRGYREEGTASYYGKKFHGRRTSAQEVYDMYAFSAAHKTLPIPSFARVTNLDNGKSVVVRVNDRGPFHEGRVIDLSLAAATKIGIVARGTGRVRVEALQPDGSAATQAVAMPADTRPTFRPDAARFAMRQDGRNMTAAEFETWLKSRNITIATGAPRPVTAPPIPATAASVVAQAVTAETTVAATAADLKSGPGEIVLQVASFSSPNNANDAMTRLLTAGINGARVIEGTSAAGARIWRLRVGPVAQNESPRVIERIAALGLGRPVRVL
ncbi:septal ring lytic transglycosylase RlpA family protein [Aquilutibacter rugosus]|uniref:septal ring lytic transglycosylase RlpA family protein n=1 Tax=Aquilutibacter rugosus TaxID=3115820 RepID=UPI002F42A5E3